MKKLLYWLSVLTAFTTIIAVGLIVEYQPIPIRALALGITCILVIWALLKVARRLDR